MKALVWDGSGLCVYAKRLERGKFVWPRAHEGARSDCRQPNNLVENALRGVALGRRNWMFVGSMKGGEAAALFYSLVGTCRLNGVEPEVWFTDVIERLGDCPINQIDDFLPWRWQASKLNNDLEKAA